MILSKIINHLIFIFVFSFLHIFTIYNLKEAWAAADRRKEVNMIASDSIDQNCPLSYLTERNFKESVLQLFYLEMERNDAERILVESCHAQVYQPNKGLDTNSIEGVAYILPEKRFFIDINYKDSKIWELQIPHERILPIEPAKLAIITPKYSIKEIRNDPRKFKFEYFPSKNDLKQALPLIFDFGMDRKVIEAALIEGGNAEASACSYQEFPHAYQGVCYQYYLPTQSGRDESFARRMVAAFYDRNDKLIGMTVGSIAVIFRDGE